MQPLGRTSHTRLPSGRRAGHTPHSAGTHVLLDGEATWPGTRLSVLCAYPSALQGVVRGGGGAREGQSRWG